MINTFFGTKLNTTQTFDDKGNRLVVTAIKTAPLTITQVKSKEKDNYWAVQVAMGQKSSKNLTRALKSHLKGAKLKQAPLFIREIRLNQDSNLKAGSTIKAADIFKPGDSVKVTGLSKGRGFAGVIKRWGFSAGPRTHGQSDRRRAPGSIGQGTDPGRVWKGKKMPGHYGHQTKTITNLRIVSLDPDKQILQVTGTVPGSRNSLLKITKTKNSTKNSNTEKLTKKPTKKPTKK